jgi:hypothetical protein
MRKKKALDLTPPEPKKFAPPDPRYYRRVEQRIGQQRLPFDLLEYPGLKGRAPSER